MKIITNTVPAPAFSSPLCTLPEKILFFDIETTGLSPRTSSLYLIGAMRRTCDTKDASQCPWEMVQWFADDYQSEEAILHAFLEYLEPYDALWHFNGSTFDIPYILAKCEKYNITPSTHCMHLFQEKSTDLLRRIRPLKKKLQLEQANQTALEHWLGIARQDTYNGGQLIKVYSEYMQAKFLHPEKASSLKETLLLHNHDDIACMPDVASILSYEEALSPSRPPAITDSEISRGRIAISFPLSCPVPKPVDLTHPLKGIFADSCASLHLEAQTAILTLPLFRGTLKFFLEPVRDYFYLPAEDTAIHKSIAAFVEPAFREKAKASNCYTKKEGTFLPSLSTKKTAGSLPAFYSAFREKPACYLLEEEDVEKQKEILTEYLLCELPSF